MEEGNRSIDNNNNEDEVGLRILSDVAATLDVTEATTTEESGHWERILQSGHWQRILEERNRSNNNTTSDREVVLDIMRDVEATLIANPTEAITTAQRPRSEDRVDAEHLVSSVTVSRSDLQNVSRSELQNITENVGLRELDEQWQGESIARTVIRGNEDYLLTFMLAENVIVIRYIDDFRDGIIRTQVIWNSKFTWRDIKQHLENDTYKFHYNYEYIDIGITDFLDHSEEEEEEGEVWVNSSVRAAIDALPAVINRQEKETGDVGMCPVCHETFSTEESAKQLPCTHSFHAKCILLWFDRKHSCPICIRKVVLLQDKLVVLNLND